MTWVQEIIKPQPDWAVIEQTFPYYEDMRACIQDPVHHAEGDVWTHTRMVFDQLSLFGLKDDVSRYSALLHDLAKPRTRAVEFDAEKGREVIRHAKHARFGAEAAWFDLWQAGVPLELRLKIYALIAWHQRVFHMWDYPDMQRKVQEFKAFGGDWKTLIAFARADTAGRISLEPSRDADLVLLQDWIKENNIYLNASSRIAYFEKEDRDPYYLAQPPQGSRVKVLSGLPGVGKDYHCRTALAGLAMVSLDDIRRSMKIDPTDNQGRVIQAGLEQARVLLRTKTPFVWNATGISKLTRGKIIGLCRDYDAHITIHAFDSPLKRILSQNADRDHVVPEQVILGLARKWEPPTLLEAHEVLWF